MISKLQQSNQPSFQGFAKFKGEPSDVNKIAKDVEKKLKNGFVFWDKKIRKEKTYYILTEEHKNTFLDFVGKVDMFDLKENIEKYINEKAKRLSLKQIKQLLKKDKFKI